MFLSILIPLTALEVPEDRVPFLGRAVHAWCLAEIARADGALADTLHGEEEYRRPFTVSGLLKEGQRPFLVLPELIAGERYAVRWTSLHAQLSWLLLERVLPELPSTVELGPLRFKVERPLTETGAHPLARQATAEALVEHWFSPNADLPRLIRLAFDSPTAVRRIHRNLVVPEPVVVFRSWLQAWECYAAPAFDADLLDLVEAQVMISHYHLRTVGVQIGQGRHVGCVGWCNYYVYQRERAARRILHLLADFAEFCGTGYKTTQGLGQTRYGPS